MAKLIDRLTLATYDDGTIEVAAEKNSLSVTQAANMLGATIREMIVEKIGLDAYCRREWGDADEAVKAFCDGLDYTFASMADWIDPEDFPWGDYAIVVIEENGEEIRCVASCRQEGKEYWILWSKRPLKKERYGQDEIMCWMPLPPGVKFRKEGEN